MIWHEGNLSTCVMLAAMHSPWEESKDGIVGNISVKIFVIFTIKEAFKPSKRD